MVRLLSALLLTAIIAAGPAYADNPFKQKGKKSASKEKKITLSTAEKEELSGYDEALNLCIEQRGIKLGAICTQYFNRIISEEERKSIPTVKQSKEKVKVKEVPKKKLPELKKRKEQPSSPGAKGVEKKKKECIKVFENEATFWCVEKLHLQLSDRVHSYWISKNESNLRKVKELHESSEEYRNKITKSDWVTEFGE